MEAYRARAGRVQRYPAYLRPAIHQSPGFLRRMPRHIRGENATGRWDGGRYISSVEVKRGHPDGSSLTRTPRTASSPGAGIGGAGDTHRARTLRVLPVRAPCVRNQRNCLCVRRRSPVLGFFVFVVATAAVVAERVVSMRSASPGSGRNEFQHPHGRIRRLGSGLYFSSGTLWQTISLLVSRGSRLTPRHCVPKTPTAQTHNYSPRERIEE